MISEQKPINRSVRDFVLLAQMYIDKLSQAPTGWLSLIFKPPHSLRNHPTQPGKFIDKISQFKLAGLILFSVCPAIINQFVFELFQGVGPKC
jgi:hypothetical protein